MAIRQKRSLEIDKQAVVDYVLGRLDTDLKERQEWMGKREVRYNKIRGWLPRKDWPWPGSSNVWVPIIAIGSLRVKSALFNAVMGFRPVVQSKAFQARNVPKQQRIDNLLDWQMFVDQDGASRLDDYISNFVDDGTVFGFVRWVKDKQSISEVRSQDPLDKSEEAVEELLQLRERVENLFDNIEEATSQDGGFTWNISATQDGEAIEARVEFYEQEDSGKIEAHIHRDVVTEDGPALIVDDLEDIVAPIRSTNLQPPTAKNPRGAPYVNRMGVATIDEIRRRWRDGTYDLLTQEDMEEIELGKAPLYTGSEQERIREEKDKLQGLAPQPANAPPSAGDSKPRELRPQVTVEHYGRWDINNDGLEEDVIFTVIKDSKKLARARYLTELYPGIPITRPFCEARFIQVPNQLYGIGLPELVEPLYDITKNLFDMNIDWGEIRNFPFFFYRATSSLQPEVMRLAPGDGYPLDNPQADVHFPAWGNENNAWVFNTMGIVQQMEERLVSISDVQLGRIPTGKASALRTVGTTMALLQQGDVRSEQTLRRLLTGIKQIYATFHRLNESNLPKNKEFHIVGIPQKGENAYDALSSEDILGKFDFEFKATMLNTNRAVLTQSLMGLVSVLISPLAFQLGLVNEETAYRLFRDFIKSQDQNPDLYLNPPSEQDRGPKILAEEAISALLTGEMPEGIPLESAAEHLKKLMEFESSDNFGYLTSPERVNLFRVYLPRKEIMAQQLQQAAAQLQQSIAGGGGGPGGVPTTVQEPEQTAPLNGGGTMPEAGGSL
jgi:hypothetical protein